MAKMLGDEMTPMNGNATKKHILWTAIPLIILLIINLATVVRAFERKASADVVQRHCEDIAVLKAEAENVDEHLKEINEKLDMLLGFHIKEK